MNVLGFPSESSWTCRSGKSTVQPFPSSKHDGLQKIIKYATLAGVNSSVKPSSTVCKYMQNNSTGSGVENRTEVPPVSARLRFWLLARSGAEEAKTYSHSCVNHRQTHWPIMWAEVYGRGQIVLFLQSVLCRHVTRREQKWRRLLCPVSLHYTATDQCITLLSR